MFHQEVNKKHNLWEITFPLTFPNVVVDECVWYVSWCGCVCTVGCIGAMSGDSHGSVIPNVDERESMTAQGNAIAP